MKRMRTQSGLSLLEMMTSSIVVAVSLLGTTAAVISGASLSSEVTRMRAAQRAATTVMEDVRATDFAEIVDTFDGSKMIVGGEEYGIDDAVASISVAQVDNGSASQLVYEVTINVHFEGATGNETYPIVTYVADRVAGNSLSAASVADPDPEPDPDPDPVVDPDPQPDPDPVVDPDPQPDPDPDPIVDPEPDPDPVVDPEPDPDPEPWVPPGQAKKDKKK